MVSDSILDASTSMALESWTPGIPNDHAALAELANTLSNILAQLTTINKHLELQGEANHVPWSAIRRHHMDNGRSVLPD
jgi:hypothetical protein